MTDLRCARAIHAKALGTLVEVRCRECSRLASSRDRRVVVYHRWDYRDGGWVEMNDRTVVRDGADCSPDGTPG